MIFPDNLKKITFFSFEWFFYWAESGQRTNCRMAGDDSPKCCIVFAKEHFLLESFSDRVQMFLGVKTIPNIHIRQYRDK
jgi:hypothetical protein